MAEQNFLKTYCTLCHLTFAFNLKDIEQREQNLKIVLDDVITNRLLSNSTVDRRSRDRQMIMEVVVRGSSRHSAGFVSKRRSGIPSDQLGLCDQTCTTKTNNRLLIKKKIFSTIGISFIKGEGYSYSL